MHDPDAFDTAVGQLASAEGVDALRKVLREFQRDDHRRVRNWLKEQCPHDVRCICEQAEALVRDD